MLEANKKRREKTMSTSNIHGNILAFRKVPDQAKDAQAKSLILFTTV